MSTSCLQCLSQFTFLESLLHRLIIPKLSSSLSTLSAMLCLLQHRPQHYSQGYVICLISLISTSFLTLCLGTHTPTYGNRAIQQMAAFTKSSWPTILPIPAPFSFLALDSLSGNTKKQANTDNSTTQTPVSVSQSHKNDAGVVCLVGEEI